MHQQQILRNLNCFLDVNEFKNANNASELLNRLIVSPQCQYSIISKLHELFTCQMAVARLCCLQFVRKAVDVCSQEVVSQILRTFAPDMFALVAYRGHIKSIQRGNDIFLEAMDRSAREEKINEGLKLGQTFFRMVLECVYVWGKYYFPASYIDLKRKELQHKYTFPIFPEEFKFIKQHTISVFVDRSKQRQNKKEQCKLIDQEISGGKTIIEEDQDEDREQERRVKQEEDRSNDKMIVKKDKEKNNVNYGIKKQKKAFKLKNQQQYKNNQKINKNILFSNIEEYNLNEIQQIPTIQMSSNNQISKNNVEKIIRSEIVFKKNQQKIMSQRQVLQQNNIQNSNLVNGKNNQKNISFNLTNLTKINNFQSTNQLNVQIIVNKQQISFKKNALSFNSLLFQTCYKPTKQKNQQQCISFSKKQVAPILIQQKSVQTTSQNFITQNQQKQLIANKNIVLKIQNFNTQDALYQKNSIRNKRHSRIFSQFSIDKNTNVQIKIPKKHSFNQTKTNFNQTQPIKSEVIKTTYSQNRKSSLNNRGLQKHKRKYSVTDQFPQNSLLHLLYIKKSNK